MTGDGGSYQVTGLSAGKYLVYFGDPFCPSVGFGPRSFGLFFADTNLAPRWYNNQPTASTATEVTVKVATNTIGIDASLALDGGISGTVTDASHAPVAGECVTAVRVNPEPDPLSGQTPGNAIAVTAGDGSYALVDLPPGHYKCVSLPAVATQALARNGGTTPRRRRRPLPSPCLPPQRSRESMLRCNTDVGFSAAEWPAGRRRGW